MKKWIFLLVISFLLTGCTVQYNLNITDDVIREKVNISVLSTDVDEDTFLRQANIPRVVYLNSDNYYNVKTSINDNFNVTYSYKHDFSDYNNSSFLEKCYEEHQIEKDGNYIRISTSNQFNCIVLEDDLSVDTVRVNITTKLKVLENNADEKKGNTYTWIMNERNYTNKPVKMTIKNNGNTDNLKKNTNLLLISLGIFIIPVVLVILFIYLNSKNKDKF